MLILRPSSSLIQRSLLSFITKAFIAPIIWENKKLPGQNSQLHSFEKRIILYVHENYVHENLCPRRVRITKAAVDNWNTLISFFAA